MRTYEIIERFTNDGDEPAVLETVQAHDVESAAKLDAGLNDMLESDGDGETYIRDPETREEWRVDATMRRVYSYALKPPRVPAPPADEEK